MKRSVKVEMIFTHLVFPAHSACSPIPLPFPYVEDLIRYGRTGADDRVRPERGRESERVAQRPISVFSSERHFSCPFTFSTQTLIREQIIIRTILMPPNSHFILHKNHLATFHFHFISFSKFFCFCLFALAFRFPFCLTLFWIRSS